MKISKRLMCEILIIVGLLILLVLVGLDAWRSVYAAESIQAGDRVVDMVGRTGKAIEVRGERAYDMDATQAILVEWDDEQNVSEWRSTEYIHKTEDEQQ